jgi:hypothetical protein
VLVSKSVEVEMDEKSGSEVVLLNGPLVEEGEGTPVICPVPDEKTVVSVMIPSSMQVDEGAGTPVM